MTPEQELVKKDLDTFSALASVAATEGGQILMHNLAKDIIGLIDIVAFQADILEEQKLRTSCIKIGTLLNMYRALVNADENMQGAQEELDALLNS